MISERLSISNKIFLCGLIASCLIGLSDGNYTYETKYINVPLDHFSLFNNQYFKLRYLINDMFWRPSDGPIFFYTGNEADVEIFAQQTNTCDNQHKYYAYLSTPQALADFVDVLNEVKTHEKSGQYGGNRSNPVIAFGGSWGGMLAAWMRMKYPAVIEGALASSAPYYYLSEKIPCNAFFKVLTKVFNDVSPLCAKNIKNSWETLIDSIAKDNGAWISKNWNLCEPVETIRHAAKLVGFLSGVYGAVGMVNYPYPNDLLMPVPANPVNEMCKHLNSSFENDESLLSATYKSISVYLNYNGKSECLNWTSSPYGSSIDMDAWGVQICSEVSMPLCTNGVTDMFLPISWNQVQRAEHCRNRYGVTPNSKFIKNEYGGKDLRYASNIIFSNGMLDPWFSGGVIPSKDLPPSVFVVDIPDAAHHLDLRAKHPNDPPSVEKARKLYVGIFEKWIRNYHEKNTDA